MAKLARQQTILELAHEAPLPNQQELCKVLARRGFQVTQATLSRDINELRLVKT
ncbi:MAG TPA: arginine repressor, partial [Candidatus Angelobacter sp.]|nr:arginine repressor [Candidatus Angelobacter sp.]